MIQLNLLPDVKLHYIKAERQRRLVTSIAVVAALVSVGILVLLLSISGLQKKHLSDLTKDISQESSELQKKPEINKILTVQNQLGSLTDLHAKKPATSKLFSYLNQVTPVKVNITNFTIDFTQQTIVITGSSDALASVNKYVDTLKFTKYKTEEGSSEKPAFSDVVLGSFGLATGAKTSGEAASYTINLKYDPLIFDISEKPVLAVPNLTTTRSSLDSPGDLFQKAPAGVQGGGN